MSGKEQNFNHFCRRLLAFLLGLSTLPAQANPTGGQVVSGSNTSISGQGTPRVNITSQDQKSIIHWESFSNKVGEVVRFDLPASAVSLNRVTGSDRSVIGGRIEGTGHVMLVNPNGISITQSGVVDLTSFTATTANILDRDFLNGNYHFKLPGNPNAGISNAGTINVSDAGLNTQVAALVNDYGGRLTPSEQGSIYVGGLAGYSKGEINRAHHVGDVIADAGGIRSVGGLAGFVASNLALTDLSHRGLVRGSGSYVGGLFGQGWVVNYWNKTLNPTLDGDGTDPALQGVNGLTAAEMTDIHQYKTLEVTYDPVTSDPSATVLPWAVTDRHIAGNYDPASPNYQTIGWRIYEGHTAPLLTTFLTPLKVTVSPDSKTYDGLAYAGSTNYSLGPLGPRDGFWHPAAAPSAGVVSGLLDSTGLNAGSYALSIQNISGKGLYSSQSGGANVLGYDLYGDDSTLTIDRADLTLTAHHQNKLYGDTFTFSGNEYTVTGLVNHETVGRVDLASAGAPAAANVGNHVITIANAREGIPSGAGSI